MFEQGSINPGVHILQCGWIENIPPPGNVYFGPISLSRIASLDIKTKNQSYAA